MSIECLLSTKKIITPEIKKHLISLGFTEKKLGCREEFEINSKEIKEDFLGYDFAIGLAARCENCRTGRKYAALVIKFDKNELK